MSTSDHNTRVASLAMPLRESLIKLVISDPPHFKLRSHLNGSRLRLHSYIVA